MSKRQPSFGVTVKLNKKDYEMLQEIKEFYNMGGDATGLRHSLKEAHRIMLRRKKIEEVTEDYKD